MNILNESDKKELLSHFPEKYQSILQKQILVIEDIITNYYENYKYSQDFRRAIDIVFADVLSGKFLGRSPNEY